MAAAGGDARERGGGQQAALGVSRQGFRAGADEQAVGVVAVSDRRCVNASRGDAEVVVVADADGTGDASTPGFGEWQQAVVGIADLTTVRGGDGRQMAGGCVVVIGDQAARQGQAGQPGAAVVIQAEGLTVGPGDGGQLLGEVVLIEGVAGRGQRGRAVAGFKVDRGVAEVVRTASRRGDRDEVAVVVIAVVDAVSVRQCLRGEKAMHDL